MQSKTQTLTKCKNELVMDFRDTLYLRYESEMKIQHLQGAKDWLKFIHDGLSQHPELGKIIVLLDTHIDNLLKDQTTTNSEVFELEHQLLNLIEGSPKNPRRLEG